MDESKYGYWFPVDVSAHGGQIDRLINIVHWFMLVLFVGWGLFFIYCLFKYRARPGHKAEHSLPTAAFTKYLEAGVVVFEFFLYVDRGILAEDYEYFSGFKPGVATRQSKGPRKSAGQSLRQGRGRN